MLIYLKLLEVYLQKSLQYKCLETAVDFCQNNLLWSRSIFNGKKPLFWEGFSQTNYFTNPYLSTSWKVCEITPFKNYKEKRLSP